MAIAHDTSSAAPASGLLRIRVRHTKNFTVLPNHLIQRRGSATAIGVAAFLFSLRDGSLVSIERLCAHFDEGRARMSRALHELEDAGYLERRTERGADGTVRTRAIVYDQPPGAGSAPASPERPKSAASGMPTPAVELRDAGHQRQGHRSRVPNQRAVSALPAQQRSAGRPLAPDGAPSSAGAPPSAAAGPGATGADPIPSPRASATSPPPSPPGHEPSAGPTDAGPATASGAALGLLARLRRSDPRLTLSRTEASLLAPEVDSWLADGVSPAEVSEALTGGLPDQFNGRPFHLLRYRLHTYHPQPAPRPDRVANVERPPPPEPLRTCARCDVVAFRSAHHTRCSACREEPR